MVRTLIARGLIGINNEMKLTADRSYDGFYRHPGHAMSVGFHEQLLSDTYGGRYTSKGHTPEIEPKTNITHRKRVPVAVS